MFCSTRTPDYSKRAVVVEDILSAIRVGSTEQAYSLLGTKVTTEQAATLGKHAEITTWLDGDRAGRQGAYAVRKAVGLVTETSNIVTKDDPKKLSNLEIRKHLCKT